MSEISDKLFDTYVERNGATPVEESPRTQGDIARMIQSPVPWVAAIGLACAALVSAGLVTLP